ncbi:MAG: hypothetical protein QOC84_502, partial [Bradyrhizobium sp.]|nr:hypothetical protein [Bradyrhizobium sp.]
GKDQVDAGSLEIAVEEQLRVGDDDRTGRRVRRGRKECFDMTVAVGIQSHAVSRKPGVKFAGVIQMAPRKKS